MDRTDFAGLIQAAGGRRAVGTAAPFAGAVLVAEPTPEGFMAAFGRGVASPGPVFLTDPGWGSGERAQLQTLLAAGGGPGMAAPSPEARGWLMIPSGGSTGKLKFARHDEATLAAAVGGFCAHFGVAQVNSLGLLPLHHVSGLMAWLRTALTGGVYLAADWKRVEGGVRPPRPARSGFYTLSLVPTQLQRLLQSQAAIQWLRDFDLIFLGGAPSWPALLDHAAAVGLRLSLSYGLTETAAMVTALRPTEFQTGLRSVGGALPHAEIAVMPEGTVRIAGASVFRGYYPDWSELREFVTEDLGSLDERGHLQLHGRRDALIVSGGKKIDPAEIEAALRSSGLFSDVAVAGLPDAEWGQAVTVFYPGDGPVPDLAAAMAVLADFPGYKRPKRFVALAPWPRNAQGKLVRSALVPPASCKSWRGGAI